MFLSNTRPILAENVYTFCREYVMKFCNQQHSGELYCSIFFREA